MKDGVSFEERWSFIRSMFNKKKRPSKFITISVQVGVTVEGKAITIDPSVIFNRLAMLIKREEKRMEMFKFELMPEPAAFFKDGCMRRPSKSILQNKILDVNFMMTDCCVVD